MNKECKCSEANKQLEEIISKYKGTKGALIPVLHEAQELYGYLPMEVQLQIANGLGVSLAEVYGVVSFYTRFTIIPRSKYQINVCFGTACYVKGAALILEKLKERLGIVVGESTKDNLFSLDICRCIGACGLAPAMTINEDVFGRLTPDQIDDIISKYEKL